ncbi:MAG: DOMON domain-containing protein [Bacillota bacterium]
MKKVFCLVLGLILVLTIVTGCEEEENNASQVEEDVTLESELVEELEYTNHFASDIDMEIYWEFSQEEDELYMVLESPGSGWLAVGFEPTNRMADAEIIIAGFENDSLLLEEHYGTGSTSHEKIDETYIENYTGEKSEEISRAEFVIPLGEDSRYDLTRGEEHTIILSYHDNSDNFIQRHTQRTTIELEL